MTAKLTATVEVEESDGGVPRGRVTWKGETFGPVPLFMLDDLIRHVVISPLLTFYSQKKPRVL